MTRCSATTYTTGTHCKNSAREGKLFCHAHKTEEKKRCKAKTVSGERCSKNSVESLYGLCTIHAAKRMSVKDILKPAPEDKKKATLKAKATPKAKPKLIQKDPKFDHLLLAKLDSDKDWATVREHFEDHIAGYVLVYDSEGIDVTFYSDLDDYQFTTLYTDVYNSGAPLDGTELFHDTITENRAD